MRRGLRAILLLGRDTARAHGTLLGQRLRAALTLLLEALWLAVAGPGATAVAMAGCQLDWGRSSRECNGRAVVVVVVLLLLLLCNLCP